MAESDEAARQAPFPIVAIGASAGGVEALESFFKAVPTGNGMAFVVVTHLDPHRQSWLAEIIGRCTPMPAVAAADGVDVAPEHVYVLPPGGILTIKQRRLQLRPKSLDLADRSPIDIFFCALAEDVTDAAVGVVLSGGGHDGTLGIRAIKEHGGLTLAQGADGTKVRFRDMPDNAVATGLVDLELPAQDMPEQIVRCVRGAARIDQVHVLAAMSSIHAILRARVGHDFSQYKDKTFGRRVQRRMLALQVTDIDAYLNRLDVDPNEAGRLFRDLLIGVTSFFRDADAFQALASLVIPKLFENKGVNDEVRVWVVGCATGEEAYSVAMLLSEHAATLRFAPKLQVFATDIDDRALAIARAGIYSESALEALPRSDLKRFFDQDGEHYRVVKSVREICVFSAHSVIRDPPFSRIDLVSCRNLLIYLDTAVQAQLFPVFHYALRPDGYLLLGQSETIARHDDLFSPVDKEHRIFRRRGIEAALPGGLIQFTPRARSGAAPTPWSPEPAAPRERIFRAAAAAAERFAPAHVVVSERGDVLHYSAGTGKYLEAGSGPPTRDLMALARKGLRLDLRAALRKAAETRRSVALNGIAFGTEGGEQVINLMVEPITEGAETVFLVVFADVGPVRAHDPAKPEGAVAAASEVAAVDQLEAELRETRQRLQRLVEELETSNEELKSSNEELMSVNEELQSANEELETSKEETQSVNEELQTVNSELQRKLEDLDRANGDLRNLHESSEVATMVLDRDLTIRSMTQSVSEIFNVTATDKGRPIGSFTSRLDEPDLEREIRSVLAGQPTVERRVTASKGAAHFLMRILPYQAIDLSIEGVLLTFTNITSVIHAEEHEQVLSAELSHRVKNTLSVVASIASQTAASSSTLEAFLEAYLGRLHALASTHDLLSERRWEDAPLSELVKAELQPYADVDSPRVSIVGPVVLVKPRAALTLGMVVHELATNSIKYGALSVADGRIAIDWSVRGRGVLRRLELTWVERDGPVVSEPMRRGFGSELIERAVAFELSGEARMTFDKTGLRCAVTLPIDPDILLPPGP
jgi:two-component system CheB/CheR fusion protein